MPEAVRYILSGSLLGIELKDPRSEPAGYMGIKDMYSLDFKEFIFCVGIKTLQSGHCAKRGKIVLLSMNLCMARFWSCFVSILL